MDCFVAVAPLRKRFAFVAGHDGGETLRFNGVNFRFNCQTACGHASAFSRRDASELCVNFRPRENRGRRESRVPIAPVGPVQKKHGGRTTGSTGNIRLSLRDGLRLTSRSPVTGLFCHRHRRNYFRQLDASVGASGPRDFAVREVSALVSSAARVHRIPLQRP